MNPAGFFAELKRRNVYKVAVAYGVIGWLLAGVSAAQSKDSGNGCQEMNEKVSALISQYKELRERCRQLPDGTYDKDLHDHGGKLHRVLASLGIELGHPPSTKQIIVGCLGEPDAIKDGRQMARFLDIYHRELRKAGRDVKEKSDREYLVYHWRGGHDFMFFISEGGLIVDHGWWFAYE
ncbi:MAG TPA: hypothetical protein VJU77_11875 [Chthoniobacterales bacterium]|nr:hypothetical protein [Chthoniobacterales bacterium]